MIHTIKPIAYIRSDFPEKFGIPRQSGLAPSLSAEIIFEPEYRSRDALRGLSDFSHIWLIWGFSANAERGWTPTVRPPRLGGNRRIGVFATRSSFRPNGLGLSSVKITEIREDAHQGPVIRVSGADLMDQTPIYDIKPYISLDCHADAVCGFQEHTASYRLQVEFPPDLLSRVPASLRDGLIEVLAQDPRPAYQNDPSRIYGLTFAGMNVQFQVTENVLQVVSLTM